MAQNTAPVQTKNIIPAGTVFLTIQKDAVTPNIRFLERNIGHLKPGLVSDAPVIAVCFNKTDRIIISHITSKFNPPTGLYTMRVKNLPDHLDAVVNDFSGQATGGFRQLLYKCPMPDNRFFVPQGCFTFQGLNEEEVEQMLEYGLGREMAGSNVFIGQPSAANLTKIFKTGKLVQGPYRPGRAPHDAYLAYTLCLRVMNMYSALSFHFRIGFFSLAHGPLGNAFSAGSQGAKIAPQFTGAVNSTVDIGQCPAEYGITNGSVSELIKRGNMQAIPQKFVNPITGLIPQQYGNSIVFPYFEGMNLVDTDVIVDTFKRYFLQICGKDAPSALNNWKVYKKGLVTLSSFAAGRAIAHAFRGIQMTEEVGTGITFLVADGQYFGFVLQHSEPFSVYAFSKKVDSVDNATVNNILGSFNQHAQALAKLVNLFRSAVRPGTTNPVYDIQRGHIDTSRKLINFWKTVDKTLFISTTFQSDLVAAFKDLQFGDNFDPPNVQRINAFLEYCQTGDDTILQDYPAYISNGYWEDRSRTHIGLGIFGQTAPSINYGAANDDGKTFQLPNNQDPIDALVQGAANQARQLSFLPFHNVPTGTAAHQWQTLFNTGRFKIPKGTVAKGRNKKETFTDPQFVDIQVGNAPTFGEIYHKIKQVSFLTREQLRGGKRANRDGDADETTGRKRAKKMAAQVADDME